MSATEELQQAIERVQAASKHYLAGNPIPFQLCWSHADDVTIFGAWGAYERGWRQVGPRLEWGATRYCGGHVDFELLASSISGEQAYTVWVERGEVCVVGRDDLSPTALRVTQLYRLEEGVWKIVHRHGDTIIEKIEATAILQE